MISDWFEAWVLWLQETQTLLWDSCRWEQSCLSGIGLRSLALGPTMEPSFHLIRNSLGLSDSNWYRSRQLAIFPKARKFYHFSRFLTEIKSNVALKWWHQGDKKGRRELSTMDKSSVRFFVQLFTGNVHMALSIDYILGSLETRSKMDKKKKSWNYWKQSLNEIFFFLKHFECLIFCVLYFPLGWDIGKTQRIVLAWAHHQPFVHTIIGCGGSLGATGRPHLDFPLMLLEILGN